MNYLFKIVLYFRFRQKFWADLFMWWHAREVRKIAEQIDLDVKNITFTPK